MKITHYGKTLAGLVSAKDLATLEECEASRRQSEAGRRRATKRRRR